jgi:hypothetical protein
LDSKNAVTKAREEYILPFEARANPFAPPLGNRATNRIGVSPAKTVDVEYVGSISRGSSIKAVIDVLGRTRIVNAGAIIQVESTRDVLTIVEIHGSEILVEQAGRQWVVPLRRP